MKKTTKYCCVMLIGFLCCLEVFSVQAASVDQYIDQAKQYEQKGEYRAAIIQLKNAVQQDDKQSQVRMLLAQAYLKIGDGASAEKELKRAKDLGADSELLMPMLGHAYIQQRKFKEVLNELKPGSDASDKARATLLALQGDL